MELTYPLKQAVLITAYRNLQSLRRLISCFDEDFDFFIHIDRKCKEESPTFARDGVYIVSKYNIQWGSEKHLWAIIDLFKRACLGGHYAYYHLITASDYPTKPLCEFKSFFSEQNDKIYVDYHQLPWENWVGEGGLERIKYYWLGNQWLDSRTNKMRLMKLLLKIQRKVRFSRNISFYPQWYGGLSYFSVPHDAALAIAKMPWSKVKRMTRFTHIAEEIYLQTVLVNTFPSERLVNNPLRYTVWQGSASGPELLTEKNYDDIIQSDAFFARKVEEPVSGPLMKQLDAYCKYQ